MSLGQDFLHAFDILVKFYLIFAISFPDDLQDFYSLFVSHILEIKKNTDFIDTFVKIIENIVIEESQETEKSQETDTEKSIEAETENSQEAETESASLEILEIEEVVCVDNTFEESEVDEAA